MGFFSGISDKIAANRQRSRDRKGFFASVIRASEDGKLTDDEIKQLQARYKALKFTQSDLREIRSQAYSTALRAVKSRGVATAEDEVELGKLQHFLMIPESEITGSKKELARLRLLTEIQNGNPPSVAAPNVILQKSEGAYWSEPASILEERVVERRYEGGSHGLSFRIAKGVSYRVGAYRGHIVSDSAVVPFSSGELIITNKRVIFRGDAKSFSLRLDKLLELNIYSNGVRLTEDNGKRHIVQFSHEGNTDVVGATLSYAINHFTNQDR